MTIDLQGKIALVTGGRRDFVPMAHEVCAESIADIAAYLTARLNGKR